VLLDNVRIADALTAVLATFRSCARDKTLTRVGGLGEHLYNFVKQVEHVYGREHVIEGMAQRLASSKDARLVDQLFSALNEEAAQIKALLSSLLLEDHPLYGELSEEDRDLLEAAIGTELLQTQDLRKLLLGVQPGEKAIKAPEDIAERLLQATGGNIREIEQLAASLKSKLGKEYDPGDGRVRAVKPRKGR
jgi:hypothetical protein